MLLTFINETMNNHSHSEQEFSLLFAGHLLIIFYCLIFTFGFLGNAAVIFVAIRKKKYRNVTNCYVVNLAVADLLFLSVSIPYTTYLGLVDTYPFGDLICNIYTYLAYVFLLATCYTLAAMSIDRYFYIVLPQGQLRWRTSRSAFGVCLIIWTTSLALIIPYHIVSHSLTSSSASCSVNEHKNFPVCLLVFCSYYAIPLMIIIVFYTKLALHVIKSNRLIASHMKPQTIPKSLKAKQRRVTRMVVVVTLAFAISWLPIHILELLKCSNSTLLNRLIQLYPKVLYTVRALTHALAYFNSCLNPYLYALLNRNFCFDLIDIMPSCFTCRKANESFQKKSSFPTTRVASIPNDNLSQTHPNEDEDVDDELLPYRNTNTINIDASCQVELIPLTKL